jgi:uncharacterized protein with HEPN domain
MPRRSDIVVEEMIAVVDELAAAVSDVDFEAFSASWVLRHAAQRGLEIISEAARHLPAELTDREPAIRWAEIRAVGNLLRHEYHRVSDAAVWAVLTDDLLPLRDALIRLRAVGR